MIEQLEFDQGGRCYRAHVGDSGAARNWWWFTVLGDNQRYGAFPAAKDDCSASVRSRIVAYYENLLDRRAGKSYLKTAARPSGLS